MKEYGEKLVKESMENVTNKSFNDLARIAAKQNPKNWKEQLTYLIGETKGVFSAKADKAVRDYLQSYYKLGEPIAKAYMTAITVQDTFGEAIQAGASDSEATLLTLGYAAAEAALLSTDLGKWIMPELRTERQRYKMIAKKLLELPEETREMSRKVGRLEGETKKQWAKRLFNIGKDIANAEYSMLPKTVGNVLASGLGEGVEEVSEEEPVINSLETEEISYAEEENEIMNEENEIAETEVQDEVEPKETNILQNIASELALLRQEISVLKNDFENERWTALTCAEMKDALMEGTPLPKGHGRLIDADAVMNDICTSIDAMTNIGIAVDGEYLWAKLNDAIYNAPTIIEAESEE